MQTGEHLLSVVSISSSPSPSLSSSSLSLSLSSFSSPPPLAPIVNPISLIASSSVPVILTATPLEATITTTATTNNNYTTTTNLQNKLSVAASLQIQHTHNHHHQNEHHQHSHHFQKHQYDSQQQQILGHPLQLHNHQYDDLSRQHQQLQQQFESDTTTTLANNMALARDTIIQHLETHFNYYMILTIFIGILIYFIYYFTIIAQRPKLITNGGSKFGQFVRDNFNDVLSRPFYPIFFWWGCNFQTALFGYMQGMTSELPKEEFLRQYLDVSDEQYYVSNVDLSEFFRDDVVPLPSKFSLADVQATATTTKKNQQQYRQNLANVNSDDNGSSSSANNSKSSTVEGSLQSPTTTTNSKQSAPRQNIVVLKPWNTDLHCPSSLVKNCQMNLSQESMIISNNSQSDLELNNSKPSSQLSSSLSSSLSSMQDDSGIETVRYHHRYNRGQLDNDRYNSNQSDDSSAAGKDSDKDSRSTTKDHVYEDNINRHKHANNTSAASSSCSRSKMCVTTEVVDNLKEKKRKIFNDSARIYQQQQQSLLQTNVSASSPSSSSSLSTSEAPQSESCRIDINNSCQSDDCGCMHNLYTPRHQFIEYGQCALDWYKTSHKNYHDNQLVALISAGMTTGSDKIYVTETAKCLNELGYEVCVFIRRGVGGLTLKSARFFSPTKWKDFEAAVDSIKLQRPNAKIVAIGFSFGALELCRYLSMTGNKSLVSAAMLISCPYNPEAGGRNMRKTYLNRLMDTYLAQYLGKMLYLPLKNKAMLDGSRCQLDFSILPKLQSLYDFEINFNRVVQYYPTTEAYAKDSILTDVISNIQVPTLCLSSCDDFMATKQMLPLAQLARHDKMAMILTKHGGHMAFVDGIWPKAPFLGQRVITRYLKVLRHSPYLNQHPTRWKASDSS